MKTDANLRDLGHSPGNRALRRVLAGSTALAIGSVGAIALAAPAQAAVPPRAVGTWASQLSATSATVNWSSGGGAGDAATGYTAFASPGGLNCTAAAPTTTCDVTGLTTGVQYTFSVVSTNADGDAQPSDASAPLTLLSAPGAPTSGTAAGTGVSGQVQLNWALPATNAENITGYQITRDGVVIVANTGDTSLSYLDTGRVNGTAYQYTVAAINSNDTVGTATANIGGTASTTPSVAPTAPTVVALTDTSATVSWTAAVDAAPGNGGSPLATFPYTVTASPGGQQCTATFGTDTCVVTGLDPAQQYTFSVTASNTWGQGPSSAASNVITLGSVPDQVTGEAAIAGDASVALTWDEPASPAGAIVGYQISRDGVIIVGNTGNTNATYTDMSAVNGTAYTYTISAINEFGTGTASVATGSVTPSGMPVAAPQDVIAVVASSTSATVTWADITNAVPGNGGSTVTGYQVTATPGGIVANVGTGVETATITGLTQGQAYTFTVAAVNANGAGAASEASNSVAPAAVPDAPTITSGTPGNGTAALVWTAGADNGSPITGYTVSRAGTTVAVLSGSTYSFLDTGLTNGTTYSYTVTATNAQGTSADSNALAVTPSTVPTAPTGIVVGVASGTTVDVSWNALDDTVPSNGGSTLQSYTVTSTPGGQTCTVVFGTQTCTVTGLTTGQAYTFAVTASNANGTGAASISSNPVTPGLAPEIPTLDQAIAGNGQVKLTWTAGAQNGAPITGYRIMRGLTSGTITTMVVSNTGSTAVSFIDTDVVNGTEYFYTVAAINSFGPSAASENLSATPATVPGVATNLSVTAITKTSATVSWTTPLSDGGNDITGYTVTSSPSALTCTSVAPTTTCDLTNLVTGQPYTFAVTATNDVGTGAASASSQVIIPSIAPSAPTAITSKLSGVGKLRLGWGLPTETGGGSQLVYRVYLGGRMYCETTALSCTVSGVVVSPATFRVTASNQVGTSEETSLTRRVRTATVNVSTNPLYKPKQYDYATFQGIGSVKGQKITVFFKQAGRPVVSKKRMTDQRFRVQASFKKKTWGSSVAKVWVESGGYVSPKRKVRVR